MPGTSPSYGPAAARTAGHEMEARLAMTRRNSFLALAGDCHVAIVNAVTDPSVSALGPRPDPTVPYPNCSAQ